MPQLCCAGVTAELTKTIWLFREQLTRVDALTKLFERFNRLLHERGYLAMGGQIVDAMVIEGSRVEHVFAAEKRRMGLVVCTIGLVRATAKIALANLAYNLSRLAWIEGGTAPA